LFKATLDKDWLYSHSVQPPLMLHDHRNWQCC